MSENPVMSFELQDKRVGVTFIDGSAGSQAYMCDDELAGDNSGKPLETIMEPPLMIGLGG